MDIFQIHFLYTEPDGDRGRLGSTCVGIPDHLGTCNEQTFSTAPFPHPFIKHESLLGMGGGTGVSQVKAQKTVVVCSVNISVVHLC